MKKFVLSLIFSASALLAGVGCAHAGQLPPTPGYNTVWTWTAPSPCSGCTYVVSTLVLSSGTTCPASTGSNYIPQQTVTTGVTGTTWTQTNTTGLTLCAVAQTIQGGNTSTASAQSAAVINPTLPSAPGVPSGNSAVSALAPPVSPNSLPVPSSQMAMNIPMQIVGHSVPRQ
jgi:hypothetical protein